jgi:hypothetical protein
MVFINAYCGWDIGENGSVSNAINFHEIECQVGHEIRQALGEIPSGKSEKNLPMLGITYFDLMATLSKIKSKSAKPECA